MIVDATEVKINRPKKNQLANYSGKKKCHAMKAQAIVTSQGRFVSLNIAVNYLPRYEVVQNESQKYRTSW